MTSNLTEDKATVQFKPNLQQGLQAVKDIQDVTLVVKDEVIKAHKVSFKMASTTVEYVVVVEHVEVVATEKADNSPCQDTDTDARYKEIKE